MASLFMRYSQEEVGTSKAWQHIYVGGCGVLHNRHREKKNPLDVD